MSWPRKVFIESTALFQLGSRLQKPEFAKLLERRDYLKYSLLVSEVSWLEYLRQRTDKMNTLLKDIDLVKNRLGEWDQEIKEITATGSRLADFLKTLENSYAERAKNARIEILPLPNLDLKRLLHMSINRIPPFEESEKSTWEKGFRDSLIMFTILQNVRKRPQDQGLVITGDVLLGKGLELHMEEFETHVSVVNSLDDAIDYIDERIDTWYRDKLRKESQQAQETLANYTAQISAQVSAIRELTDSDMRIGGIYGLLGGSRTLDQGETVEKVHSLVFDAIESAIWKDTDKPISRILFRIRCTANVTTSTRFWNPLLASSRYVVGGEKQLSDSLGIFAPRQEKERALRVRLYGEAQFKRVEEDWELSSLKIDKSPPGPEELAALHRGETKDD